MNDDRIEIAQLEFLEKHRDADELVFGVNSRECLAAVYYSPKENRMKSWREFFAAVRDAEIERQERST